MAKFLTLSIVLALFCAISIADPIFLLSSKKINNLSDQTFFNTQSFTNLLENKALDAKNLPNNIFVFNVKVQDKKYLQTPGLLLKDIAPFTAIQNHFKPSENTFSSVYVEDALSKNFNDQLIKIIEQKGFQVFNLPIKAFSFERVKNLKQATNQSVLCVSDIAMKDLAYLDYLFVKNFNSFGFSSGNNYLIVLKFSDDTENAVENTINNFQVSGRILEGEEPTPTPTPTPSSDEPTPTPTPTPGEDPKPTPPPVTNAIGISAAGFSGFITAILLTMALYTCNAILNNIRSPVRFSKEALHIGKEQL